MPKMFMAAKRNFRTKSLALDCINLNSLFVPLSALLVFLTLRGYLESFLNTPESISRKQLELRKKGAHNPGDEPSPLEKQLYSQHGPYITAADMAPESISRKQLELRKKGAHNPGDEPSPLEKQLYSQHGPYITAADMDFQTSVAGCGESSRPDGVQQKARQTTQTVDAVFLVCSAVQNADRRRLVRHMYGDSHNTWPYAIKLVFLVGLANTSTTEADIRNESLSHGDILQDQMKDRRTPFCSNMAAHQSIETPLITSGNFVDHYYNLSYKTVLGYRWAQLHCRDVTLVAKIDDDVFVDTFKFFDYFLPIIPIRQRVIYGYLNSRPKVHRRGKYWVSQAEFSGQRYPQFCNGYFVLATRDVIERVYEVSRTVRYFRLEDVFTYAAVRRAMLDVQLVHLGVITHFFPQYRACVKDHKYRCKFLAAELPVERMLEYHDLAREQRRMLYHQ
ncbi:hypothetical protein EGW08_018485 [Elysia chlorotica]|uniref:Hexosyltransferase n=1 Tax=Elysia chlorotica TaxID=188477 RepID=A0A3S1BS99_ELYCH|nr:hypothetical protein EGW08_018485 [Elysia chlorotica]